MGLHQSRLHQSRSALFRVAAVAVWRHHASAVLRDRPREKVDGGHAGEKADGRSSGEEEGHQEEAEARRPLALTLALRATSSTNG